jgi:RimJ/RimL family protein N-acetyltransferase
MTLDWSSRDMAALEPQLERARAEGVQFITYAEVDNTINNQRRLYNLNKTLSASIPIEAPEDFPEFDLYVDYRLSSDVFPHRGIFLAVADQEWVGMTQISLHPDYAFVEMTGVLPAYRRRGIAQALKHLSICFARQHNYTKLQTINDVKNEPMLAVNRKAGFQPDGGFYFVSRLLNETTQ